MVGRILLEPQQRVCRALARVAGAVVLLLGTGTVLVVASPVAAMDTESVCLPVAARFHDTWRTVDAASGRVAHRFGTLTWTRSGVDYDIRNGFAVEVCTASVDAEAGIGYSAAGAKVRGPATGRLRHEDLAGIGFGYVAVPRAVPTNRLPATGAIVPGGLVAAALGVLAAGGGLCWRAPYAPTGLRQDWMISLLVLPERMRRRLGPRRPNAGAGRGHVISLPWRRSPLLMAIVRDHHVERSR